MNIIKCIAFLILTAAAIALIAAAWLPKTFHAGSAIVIDKPSPEVFDYIKQLKLQGNYDNWSRKDPNLKKEFAGKDGAIGSSYSWRSNKIGTGKQIITDIEQGKRVSMVIYLQGLQHPNIAFIQVDSLTADASLVAWEIDGKLPFPFNIIPQFYDMNKDFSASLERLKTILEK
ncbi:SRPBCC family protein [Sphingobacterium sp. Mn56C]|uniref:SRPBCC family protein n=1 Tax=Sphingobacterium sp. Mn56C TaxID=3395261 RepID=UPI003BEDC839